MKPFPVLVAATLACLTVPILHAQDAPKPKQKPTVYDEAADGRQQVAAAVAKAKRDNQRVLIQWGGNWCGWCIVLHDGMKADATLSKKLRDEYQLVHVDTGKNKELAKELGAEFKSVPFLTILDADGKPLVQQNTEPFETNVDGKIGHDAKKLVEFLTQHQAKPLVAADVLAAGPRPAGRRTSACSCTSARRGAAGAIASKTGWRSRRSPRCSARTSSTSRSTTTA